MTDMIRFQCNDCGHRFEAEVLADVERCEPGSGIAQRHQFVALNATGLTFAVTGSG